MPQDHEIADDLISERLRRSPSYHADYGEMTYGEIKRLAMAKLPDGKVRQRKKLIEQGFRLSRKSRRPR